MEQAVYKCITFIENTFIKDNISNTDRDTLEALIIRIYDTLCDACEEEVDGWEMAEELRNEIFGND